MLILTIDVKTGQVKKEKFKKSELEVGLEWLAEAGKIHEMFLRVTSRGQGATKVKPTIKIGGKNVWNKQCTKTATSAITCHWTIDVGV